MNFLIIGEINRKKNGVDYVIWVIDILMDIFFYCFYVDILKFFKV